MECLGIKCMLMECESQKIKQFVVVTQVFELGSNNYFKFILTNNTRCISPMIVYTAYYPLTNHHVKKHELLIFLPLNNQNLCFY